MKTRPKRNIDLKGSSLLECLVTLLTMSVSLSALVGYRYHCVKSLENTKSFAMAVRTGHMIAEIWAGQEGDPDYDLSNYTFSDDFQVRLGSDGPSQIPSGFIGTGYYDIQAEDRVYKATLAYQDSEDITGLRNLYTILTWADGSWQEQCYTFSSMTQTQDGTSGAESVGSEVSASASAISELMEELSSTMGETMSESSTTQR